MLCSFFEWRNIGSNSSILRVLFLLEIKLRKSDYICEVYYFLQELNQSSRYRIFSKRPRGDLLFWSKYLAHFSIKRKPLGYLLFREVLYCIFGSSIKMLSIYRNLLESIKVLYRRSLLSWRNSKASPLNAEEKVFALYEIFLPWDISSLISTYSS